jgi:RNA polymerase sigma-70 factor (ECF subfamily)
MEITAKNHEQSSEDGLSISQYADEDVALVAAIATGDLEAEHRFAMRFMPRVRAMLLARSRNSDVVPDLQQEAMIEAICALRRGQLRDPAKLVAFVIGVTRNVLNSHFRNAARQPESLELPDDLPDLSKASDAGERTQREALVTEALLNFDAIDRKIMEMTLLEGLKPGAIAERLKLSDDVVRQRKLRATRRVMELVSNQSQKAPQQPLPRGDKS